MIKEMFKMEHTKSLLSLWHLTLLLIILTDITFSEAALWYAIVIVFSLLVDFGAYWVWHFYPVSESDRRAYQMLCDTGKYEEAICRKLMASKTSSQSFVCLKSMGLDYSKVLEV